MNLPTIALLCSLSGIVVGHTVTHAVYRPLFEAQSREAQRIHASNLDLRHELRSAETGQRITEEKMEVFKEALGQLGLLEHVEIIENKLTIGKEVRDGRT